MKSVALGVFGIHKQGVGTLLLWVVGPGLQGFDPLALAGLVVRPGPLCRPRASPAAPSEETRPAPRNARRDDLGQHHEHAVDVLNHPLAR